MKVRPGSSPEVLVELSNLLLAMSWEPRRGVPYTLCDQEYVISY